MTSCILCLGQLKKGKSVKLSEPVCDTFTLGDAIRQQIHSNILLPYTQSSSKLTCKSCLCSFQTFFKFLTKVNKNLNNFKTDDTFEISPECHQIQVPPNFLTIKMEPQILIPRVKTEGLNDESFVKVDILEETYDTSFNNFDNFEEKIQESVNNLSESIENAREPVKTNDYDRFSDDSDFAWSYDDPMDSMDDNEASIMNNDRLNASKSKESKKEQNKESSRIQSRELSNIALDYSNFDNIKIESKDEPKKINKKSTKNSTNSNQNLTKSGIKTEQSDDDFDTSEIKNEISGADLIDSDDDLPLSGRKSTRSNKSTLIKRHLEGDDIIPKKEEAVKSQKTSRKAKSDKPKKSTFRTLRLSNPTKDLIKSENPEQESSKQDIKPSITDPNAPLPLFPAKTQSGYIRYLPRDQITLEMVNSGQKFVVIDGVEYRIPQTPAPPPKPKKKKSAGFTHEEDASRRTHPSRDPEGEQKVRTFVEIKCYECGTEFESFFKLKKHYSRFHPDKQAYLMCCGKNFKRRCDLLDHIEQHDRSAIHMCEICNREYKTKNCLNAHKRFYHPKDGSEEVICYDCGKILKNSNLLKLHLLTHETDLRSYECYVCKKKFKRIQNVKRHIKLNHPITPNKVVCHICSASVKEAYLSSHMKTVHNSDRTRINCERCGTWILKSNYKTHFMKHADMGVNCKVCGKFLKSSYSLTTHLRTVHGDSFKFNCEFCGKGFHRDVKMKEHIAVKHTREFPFKCRVIGCGREFRAEGNWRMHEKKYHPEEYNKFFKPFYFRNNEEIKELEEMMQGSSEQV